jgi:hypothetical protein
MNSYDIDLFERISIGPDAKHKNVRLIIESLDANVSAKNTKIYRVRGSGTRRTNIEQVRMSLRYL